MTSARRTIACCALVPIAVAACGGRPGAALEDRGPRSPASPAAADAVAAATAVDASPAAPPVPIQRALDQLSLELAAAAPGTELAIAFLDLTTGETAELDGDEVHVSASAAKAWWVAAALDVAGLDAVAPHAEPIFRKSDNREAGAVIDLVGANAVNTWTWKVAGMTHTALTEWSFGTIRVAGNSPRRMGGDNYMTAHDAVTFLGKLARKELLADDRGDALRTWLTWSPDAGLGGWLGARLPIAVQPSVQHKAGWLPPGCCSSDAIYNTLNELGIVTAPDGRAYAIAILARRGSDFYGAQAPFVELASCRIYRAFVHDDALSCDG